MSRLPITSSRQVELCVLTARTCKDALHLCFASASLLNLAYESVGFQMHSDWNMKDMNANRSSMFICWQKDAKETIANLSRGRWPTIIVREGEHRASTAKCGSISVLEAIPGSSWHFLDGVDRCWLFQWLRRNQKQRLKRSQSHGVSAHQPWRARTAQTWHNAWEVLSSSFHHSSSCLIWKILKNPDGRQWLRIQNPPKFQDFGLQSTVSASSC